MQTEKIAVSRGTFNVRTGGTLEGIPLVLLHGWPESSFCWEALGPHLDGRFRIIAPDLRGLGDSERTLERDCYQKAELAKDVAQIVDTLGIGVFHLAGHDWGGIVAQEVALLLPERVRRLAIMNIPVITNAAGNEEAMRITQARGSVSLWYQYFQQQPGLAEAMIPGNEETWIRYFFGKAGREGKIPEAAIREYIRCYGIEGTPAAGANYYRTMRYDAQRWATLAGTKFPMPALYIYGNQDSVIIPAYLNHLEGCFDDLMIAEIGAEHFVQEQEPQAVATLLNKFFR